MKRRISRWATLAGVLSLLAAPALPLGGLDPARAAPSPAENKRLAPEDVLVGEWWTDNNQGRIRFSKAPNGTLRGITTCCVPRVSTPDHPAYDIHNPNPKLRGRSTVGIVLIWNLTYEEGEYSDGYVYNPRDGKVYRFAAKIIDANTVKIRGYMGIPLFGQSQIWKRVRVEDHASSQAAAACAGLAVRRCGNRLAARTPLGRRKSEQGWLATSMDSARCSVKPRSPIWTNTSPPTRSAHRRGRPVSRRSGSGASCEVCARGQAHWLLIS